MKKKLVILMVLAIVITSVFGISGFNGKSVIAAPVFQRVNNVNAVVTANALNVRQGASTAYRVVCVLKKGQTVKIFGKLGNWYAIYETKGGCVGAVDSRYIRTTGTTAKPAPVPTKVPVRTAAPKPVPTKAPGVLPPAGVSQEEQQMLNLVNKARADAGLKPLAFDAQLQKVARLKAQDMVNKNYFSHQSPTYGSPFDMMKQFGVSFKTAGENIAGNQTVERAFNAWMGSPGHKKNILTAGFNLTGIGIVNGSQYGKIFVQEFIGR